MTDRLVKARVARAYLWRYTRDCEKCGAKNQIFTWAAHEEYKDLTRVCAVECGTCGAFLLWEFDDAGHLVDETNRHLAELAADQSGDDGEWGELPKVNSVDTEMVGAIASAPIVEPALPDEDF